MPRQLYNVSLTAVPTYGRNSKMTQYDLLLDPKINTVRCGFYQSKYKGYQIRQGDQFYTVDATTEHRIDKISILFYASAMYDWIIEDANNLYDPIQQLVAGTKLIIPDKSQVYMT